MFSAITFELSRRGAAADFAAGRRTPSHAQVSELIDRYFDHFTPQRRQNLIRTVAELYRDRLTADYFSQRIDRDAGRKASRLANRVSILGGDAMTDSEVFAIVDQTVDANQPNDYHLNVLRDGMRHSGNWWYVVVQPNKEDIRSYEYSNLMAKIEHDIETQYDLNVLLVPVTPD